MTYSLTYGFMPCDPLFYKAAYLVHGGLGADTLCRTVELSLSGCLPSYHVDTITGASFGGFVQDFLKPNPHSARHKFSVILLYFGYALCRAR